MNRAGSKRKFDIYSRAIVTLPNYTLKIAIYLLSWGFKAISKLLIKIAKKREKINKFVFYFVYYHNKIHFGIFNAVLSQGVLLMSRTVLHTKTFPSNFSIFLDKIISIVCLILVCADFFLLFKTVLDYKETEITETRLKTMEVYKTRIHKFTE